MAISNEKIMAALIACGSVRAAAKAACVSETTIRARLNDTDFRTEYEKAKSEILREACDMENRRMHASPLQNGQPKK